MKCEALKTDSIVRFAVHCLFSTVFCAAARVPWRRGFRFDPGETRKDRPK